MALRVAQQALPQRDYEQAAARFQEAAEYYPTDLALAGLKAARDAQAEQKARAEAERQKREQEAQRPAA